VICAKTATKLLAQMKGETLMLVPQTSHGSRATIGALRSLGKDKGVSFHTFSPLEDMRALIIEKIREAHARGRDQTGA
jgi:hypothetical protein